jgi:hypothetical protein
MSTDQQTRPTAEERRFTPPQERSSFGKPPRRQPGPIMRAGTNIVERYVLRGRPRTDDNSGEWATWEEYTQTNPTYDTHGEHALIDSIYQVPKRITEAEAADIVAEFTERVPDYEFQVVHAEILVKETVLA